MDVYHEGDAFTNLIPSEHPINAIDQIIIEFVMDIGNDVGGRVF